MNQDDSEVYQPQQISQEQSQESAKPTQDPSLCETHSEELILFCLKDQIQVCSKCLKSTHLLHPVVPINSLENLDFSESLASEISQALGEVKNRERLVNDLLSKSLTLHKIKLRNHIMFIRDNLRQEFDDFFNSLLQSIRKDWNLFNVQEILIQETKKFNDKVTVNLDKITDGSQLLYPQQDIKKFYESLSDAQAQVQQCKNDWSNYENNMQSLIDSLKDHSEFESIDGNILKQFMAERLVLNYSNIELQRILFQQPMKKSGSNSPIVHPQFRKHSYSVMGVGNNKLGQSMAFGSDQQLNGRVGMQFSSTLQKMGISSQLLSSEESITNKLHFFKFDQRILTFYNVETDKKTRELLNIEFNIPIRFCSIQTKDGRIFITGGARNSTQSSNSAYEYKEGTLAQLPNMQHPREGHCLAAIGSTQIFAIGSRLYNTSKTCEVYQMDSNEWREQPELNRNRYLSTAVTLNERFIYVLGGYEPQVTDIERLDTWNLSQGSYWELIKIYSPNLENDIKYWFGSCPVSSTEILIFGGKKDGASSQASYIFDTASKQVIKTGNLPNKDTFYQRTFLQKNGKVHAYGYENDSAYIYNISTKTWSKK